MRTAPALVVVTAALLALTGCLPDDDPVLPEPLPSATPIFASDEEALAAAEEALVSYLRTVDAILADGGANPERLELVATGTVVAQDGQGFAEAQELGSRSVGQTAYDTLSLQQYDGSAVGTPLITVYVCEDFSGKDVLNSDGQSTVNPDRRTRWPLVVGFDLARDGSLLVSSVEDWSGDDFCEV